MKHLLFRGLPKQLLEDGDVVMPAEERAETGRFTASPVEIVRCQFPNQRKLHGAVFRSFSPLVKMRRITCLTSHHKFALAAPVSSSHGVYQIFPRYLRKIILFQPDEELFDIILHLHRTTIEPLIRPLPLPSLPKPVTRRFPITVPFSGMAAQKFERLLPDIAITGLRETRSRVPKSFVPGTVDTRAPTRSQQSKDGPKPLPVLTELMDGPAPVASERLQDTQGTVELVGEKALRRCGGIFVEGESVAKGRRGIGHGSKRGRSATFGPSVPAFKQKHE